MLLENRIALIYSVGGSIDGAVTCSFAHESAQVSLTGRTQASLGQMVEKIHLNGGMAGTAIVD